ncbi:helix-turn-helix transcriptional regulator [Salinigranum halophilum]|jgi:predicted transcriptional regulator|uniref:helix-turn-helix transcriptional regulator n=1 Tax=Salinigranum halophilum TaxID=2565931 RepID=UPI0010A79646|nr:transcriptional regulator [Salinigranum halophilum]
MTGADSEIIDELLQHALDIQHLGPSEASPDSRLSTDDLLDVVRHRDLFEALYDSALDRRDLEDRLGVSRATSHRFTRWLEDEAYAERVDGRYHLTGEGEVVAEAVLQFERKIRTADRLAPLLDVICEEHRDFVVEPFENATVTVATPSDPYAPVTRFLTLLRGCERFRGFNTTHMIPPGLADLYGDPFADCEVELISPSDVVGTLQDSENDRIRRRLRDDHLKLRTREALPYGLALFDDRVGIGGYDEETGAMRVFVDTDAPIARAWGERVYETFKQNSTPVRADASRERREER